MTKSMEEPFIFPRDEKVTNQHARACTHALGVELEDLES